MFIECTRLLKKSIYTATNRRQWRNTKSLKMCAKIDFSHFTLLFLPLLFPPLLFSPLTSFSPTLKAQFDSIFAHLLLCHISVFSANGGYIFIYWCTTPCAVEIVMIWKVCKAMCMRDFGDMNIVLKKEWEDEDTNGTYDTWGLMQLRLFQRIN